MEESREKTLSGQIEYVLSNENGLRFVWTTVSTLTAVATSCNNGNNMQQNWKMFYPGKLNLPFPVEMVSGLSEEPFQCWLQLQHLARSFFFVILNWVFMSSWSFSSGFSMLESACYVLSRIYWWLQQVQRLAIICNKAKITVFLVVEPALSNGADLRCVQELLKQFPLQRYTN